MPWPIKKLGEIIQHKAFSFLIVGLIINLVGSIIILFGALPSNTQISNIGGTYFDSNKFLIENLQQNRNFAQIGLVGLILGFTCQVLGTWGSKKKNFNT